MALEPYLAGLYFAILRHFLLVREVKILARSNNNFEHSPEGDMVAHRILTQ